MNWCRSETEILEIRKKLNQLENLYIIILLQVKRKKKSYSKKTKLKREKNLKRKKNNNLKRK